MTSFTPESLLAYERDRNAQLEGRVRDLEAALKQRDEHIRASVQAIDDLNVQVRFWRQCAEHAVTGWNALEEKIDTVVHMLEPWRQPRTIFDDVLNILVEPCPEEPPALPGEMTIDLADGVKLRVVEDETLRPGEIKLRTPEKK